ncbi:hypothetical protein DN824_04465 [Stutzerimonas nosocomialis]|uniref:DUF1232 domain-containing protein n=1 Tax=Stutzerimonas nosocomialis TaxID=1056496 RepID=A0A5R9QDL1_9GAMM|nr:YkvA family protein [Stutzerimonas nosocomialis]TLX59531.1 hypothetical protein DN826_01655 [Stutzerimonas nosocomialis]TLX60471.1 hypothetical protein DN824_04465 [Stutzerimonas nosocomialis]TLX63020.1 hypothetical protein DN820_13455 [Stutzerimonas nosocomialis]
MKAPWNFLRYLPLAQRVLSRGRLPLLLMAVARKRKSGRGAIRGIGDDLRTLQALCVAWWRGEYRAVSTQALLAVVAGLLYFVSPLDAIPDWLPGIGFLDDIAVLGWVMNKWSGELDAFRAWRQAQSPTKQADLERLPAADEAKA